MNRRRPAGIALLLVAGALSILAVVGAAFIRMAGISRASGAASVEKTGARLLAVSGLEYAGARLSESTAADPGNPSDDWTFRDDPVLPLERSLNPSYAHSEPYTDVTGDGRYGPGDVYIDLNRNGRFDARTGRLREGGGTAAFALKLGPTGGRIDVNQGYLGASDVDHNHKPDYNYLGDGGISWDAFFGLTELHRRVADVINLVGLSLGTQDTRIGNTLLLRRPLGGYQTFAQLASRMSPADAAKLMPYLALAPQDTAWFCSVNDGWPDLPRKRSLLSAAEASATVLQASFQGLSSETPLVYASQTQLSAQDAAAVADFIRSNLPVRSWLDFYRRFNAAKLLVFAGTDPYYANIKLDLAMANAIPETLCQTDWIGLNNLSNYSLYPPAYSWQSFDEPRAAFERGEDRVGRQPSGKSLLKRMVDPTPTQFFPGYNWYGGLELSLAPGDGAFSAESLGRVDFGRRSLALSRASAMIGLKRAVSATAQSDFENVPFAIPEYKPVVFGVVDSERWTRRQLPDGLQETGTADRDRIETYPIFAADRSYDRALSYGNWLRAQPYWGDLRLMTYCGYRLGDEAFYVPGWGVWNPLRGDSPSEFGDNVADVARGAVCTSHSTSNPPPVPCCIQAEYYWGAGTVDPAVWSGYRLNDAEFPLIPANGGSVEAGTIELYPGPPSNNLNHMLPAAAGATFLDCANPMKLMLGAINSSIPRSPMGYYTWQEGGGPLGSRQSLLAVQPANQYDWHHVAFAFGAQEVQGYVDGIPDPGLHGDYSGNAVQTFYPRDLWFQGGDLRMFPSELPPGDLAIHAAEQHRYWVPGLQPPGAWSAGQQARLEAVPVFTSPLYRFEPAAILVGARWDGFVPRILAAAASRAKAAGNRGGVPLAVDLLLYSRSDGTGEERKVRLPEEAWADGGGWTGFPWRDAAQGSAYRGVGSFRFRVTMDASAVADEGDTLRDTPVFDSITVHFRNGVSVSAFFQE